MTILPLLAPWRKKLDVHEDDAVKGAPLTCRQQQVLRLLAEGRTQRQIAEELRIRIRTVEMHIRHIRNRLAIQSVALLTRYAVRTGLVEA